MSVDNYVIRRTPAANNAAASKAKGNLIFKQKGECLMNKMMPIGDDYSLSRIPLNARSSLLRVTLVRVGAITTLA